MTSMPALTCPERSRGSLPNGTVPDETVWDYGYDYENRLTSVTDNDEYTAAYSYAADGVRLRAQESNHAHTDRFFLYDGVRPTAEGTLSGDTWTTTERYVWEGDSYYDPLVYLVYDNTRYYPLFDGLGSTRQLTDEDEDVTDTYSYEAFGNSMGSTGSTVNPYRYVGSLGYYQIYPPAGGPALMHLGARYYMPEIGRFISQDPVYRPWMRYGYVFNRPTFGVDPKGLNFYTDWACNSTDPIVQMTCPKNWHPTSPGDKAMTDCYYDCLKGQQCRAAITGGVGAGVGLLAGEGFGPVGFLAGLASGELIALHDCAAQCGYGKALF